METVHGVAVRYWPSDVGTGLWHEVTELGDGRLGVAVGRSTDTARARRRADRVRAVLHAGGDPAAALADWPHGDADEVAACAVIDRLTAAVIHSSRGGAQSVMAAPASPAISLTAAGTMLPPGATVLLCTGPADRTGPPLNHGTVLPPDQAADRIVEALAHHPTAAVALLYRHAPAPLEMTVPAAPANLATVRNQLRHWLAFTGVDAETAADSLLAVGEAASNATEHSVVGTRHAVDLTVSAAVDGDRLRFTVADNGCWKPPPNAPGHRGHGIRLINALVDDAELMTDEQGTTVEMVKDLRR